jgi:hypothetical protein
LDKDNNGWFRLNHLECERRSKSLKAEPNHHVKEERTGTGWDDGKYLYLPAI